MISSSSTSVRHQYPNCMRTGVAQGELASRQEFRGASESALQFLVKDLGSFRVVTGLGLGLQVSDFLRSPSIFVLHGASTGNPEPSTQSTTGCFLGMNGAAGFGLCVCVCVRLLDAFQLGRTGR